MAVSKSPRLPQVASFWATLSDRLAGGVTYRRVVDLDEIIDHGLTLVQRDIEDQGIDLRVLPAYPVTESDIRAAYEATGRADSGGRAT